MLLLLPLLFVGGIVALRFAIKPSIQTRTIAGARTVSQTQRPYLARLISDLRRGREPQEWMIEEAMVEAYDLGDWKMVAKLNRRFFTEDEGDYEDEIEESDQPDDEEEQEPNEPPDDTEIVEAIGGASISASVGSSPFDGVPDDAWDRFVASMETQSADYQGPKHVGRFHHSKERLAQLKIDDVSTPEKQYEALVTDLSDAKEQSRSLITEFEFQPIALEDGEKTITLSGILAVIKSAGMDHARSWFVNSGDRKKFPKTTEMFSKANGVF